jgi:hypothetical protein
MLTVHPWNNSNNTSKQQNNLLNSLLDALEIRFASDEPANRSLVSLLNSLASHLQMHFEWNESDINFAGLERRAPWLAGNIEQLKSEQQQLLHDVEVLIGLARLAFAEKQDIKSLADRYQALETKFAEHEAVEKKLLQQAFSSNPALND